MSYVTYELDAINKVPLVANAAGCDACKVGWGLAQLWAYCFRETTDVVSDKQLVGIFGVKHLGEHLADFDFLEALEDGRWRVRGADRYLRIKEARREGGRKGGQRTQERKRDGQAELKQTEALKSLPATADRGVQAQPKQNPSSKSLPELKQNPSSKSLSELKQKQALSPITEVPSKEGTSCDASERPVEVAPPSAPLTARSVARAPPTNGKRTRLQPGTPEWEDAVKRDDWAALGWDR